MARILVVDDSATLLDVYRDALEDEGYEVSTATSGEDALEAIHRARPDLIVTDVFMPGMNGLELISHVRSDPASAAVPIIVVSGMTSARTEALRRGALTFAAKPLDLDGLLDLVRDGVAGRATSSITRDAAAAAHRLTTRALGAAAFNTYVDHEPEAMELIQAALAAIDRFFGTQALLVLARDGKLEATSPAGGPGAGPGPLTPGLEQVARSVIETASSVVISGSGPAGPVAEELHLAFLAAVPLMLGPIPIGALLLTDDHGRSFSGAELSLLEHVAARAAVLVGHPAAVHSVDRNGLVRPETFSVALTCVMQLSSHLGQPLGVAVARFPAPIGRPAGTELMRQLPQHALVGSMGRRAMALFALADSPTVVHERMAALRAGVARATRIDMWSQLVMQAPLPPVTAEVLIDWCAQAADTPEATPTVAHGIEVTSISLDG